MLVSWQTSCPAWRYLLGQNEGNTFQHHLRVLFHAPFSSNLATEIELSEHFAPPPTICGANLATEIQVFELSKHFGPPPPPPPPPPHIYGANLATNSSLNFPSTLPPPPPLPGLCGANLATEIKSFELSEHFEHFGQKK